MTGHRLYPSFSKWLWSNIHIICQKQLRQRLHHTHSNSLTRKDKVICNHTLHVTSALLYSFHKWDVIRVEAITLSCKIPQKTGYACIAKENLNVLSMLMNYKHFHLTYFMQKVITSVHSVNNQYATIWGYFSKVKACQRLCYTLKF
jgi:hypothetical protein